MRTKEGETPVQFSPVFLRQRLGPGASDESRRGRDDLRLLKVIARRGEEIYRSRDSAARPQYSGRNVGDVQAQGREQGGPNFEFGPARLRILPPQVGSEPFRSGA